MGLFVAVSLCSTTPFRMVVQDIFKIGNIDQARVIVCGQVETGVVRLGMTVHFSPADLIASVKSVSKGVAAVPEAVLGDSICLELEGNIAAHGLRSGSIVSESA